MTIQNKGNHSQGEALPTVQINLAEMSLADLNNLLIAVAWAAAPKWREMGAEMTRHPVPVIAMSGENVAVQYLKTNSGVNAVCHFAIELPSLPALAEVVSQKSIYRRGYEAVRELFKN